MTLGPQWVWLLLGGGLLGGLAVGGTMGSCDRGRDESGRRADSVLATDTTWQQTVRVQDAVIARQDSVIAATERERARWKRLALRSLRAVDSLQVDVDSTLARGVPDSVSPAAYWQDQYAAQRRVAVTLRLETVPRLLAVIAADSAGIAERDVYGAEMRRQRDEARARTTEITREWEYYRAATKPGLDLGVFRVPAWVGYAAAATGGAMLAYVAVK